MALTGWRMVRRDEHDHERARHRELELENYTLKDALRSANTEIRALRLLVAEQSAMLKKVGGTA